MIKSSGMSSEVTYVLEIDLAAVKNVEENTFFKVLYIKNPRSIVNESWKSIQRK